MSLGGATFVPDLKEMASKVDFLSLHCPLTTQTRHMINSQVLEAMKPSAILVNAARGPVVEEKALYKALKQKSILTTGLDVFEHEPPDSANPLLELDNITITPHFAAFTEEGRRRMGVTAAKDILRVLKGDAPVYPVKPQPWD